MHRTAAQPYSLPASAPRRQRESVGFVTVVDGRLKHDDYGVAGGGLGGNVHRHHGEDGKGREKELDFALDVALLDQVHVLAAEPAPRVEAAAATRHTQRVRPPQRRFAFGVHAHDPVHGRQTRVKGHEPEPDAAA